MLFFFKRKKAKQHLLFNNHILCYQAHVWLLLEKNKHLNLSRFDHLLEMREVYQTASSLGNSLHVPANLEILCYFHDHLQKGKIYLEFTHLEPTEV